MGYGARGRAGALPQSPHRTGSSSCSGVSLGLFGKPKRSTSSRFAASIEAHRAVSSETLMLQVRFAHPPNCAPSYRFFVLFRSAYFPSPHRTGSSSCSGVSLGLFSEKGTPYSFLQNARPSGSLRSPSEPRTALPFLCAFPVGLFGKPKRSSFSRIRGLHRSTLCFFFQNAHASAASLTLRTPHRPPVSSPLAAAAD